MFLVLLLEEVDACCVLVPEWVSATFFFFPGTDSFAGPHVVHMLASGHNTHK